MNRVARLSAFSPLLVPLLAAVLAAPVRADARLESDPTGWWHYYGATAAQISSLISANNARLVDFEVESTAPLTFTASFVRNSGEYQVSGWWYYYGVTISDIVTLLNTNQARLIDLRRYDAGGVDRFTCVMVRNTGAEGRAWWWYVGVTASQVSTFLSNNNARLVSLSSFESGGTRYYDVVMLSNTGGDALAWWWYIGVTGSQVSSFLATNNARLYDIEIYNDAAGTRRFNVVMVRNTGAVAAAWWWYYDVTVSQIVSFVNQNGARVFDIESYTLPGGARRYGVLMVNNSNALTSRIGAILQYGADGATGCYLKHVDGAVLASLQPSFVFEPASTIKALIALHFMRGVQAGSETMGASHSVFTAYTGSCPLDMNPVTESFRVSLHRMLKNSDNARTQFFRRRYGNEAINNTASSVAGMTNSAVHHRLGCGDSAVANPNELTLADAGRMYERIFNATALNPANRDSLRQYLVNETDGFPFQTKLNAIVDAEAAALGLASSAPAFKSQIRFAFKAGSYGLFPPGMPGLHYYYSIAGWLRLPACGASRTDGGEYVFGIFIHASTNEASTSDRLWTASAELFREQIRAALPGCVLSVDPASGPAAALDLAPPRPNPARGSTTLHYTLPIASAVKLAVYDVGGREVATLAQGVEGPGERRVTWEARDRAGRALPAGIYWARLEAAGAERVRKLVVER